MAEWQPIETAPKDGTRVLVFVPGIRVKDKHGFRKTHDRIVSAMWSSNPDDGVGHQLSAHAKELIERHGGFWTGQSIGRRPTTGSPTHWMPLPPPPIGGETG